MARIDWAQLPSDIRRRVERVAGAEVREAQTQAGGFSAGIASRVTFDDGQRLFVKAVPTTSEGTFELYIREAEMLRAIPRDLPAAHLVDAFSQDDWTVLVIEDVEGRHPERSASSTDTTHVLDAIAALATVPTDHTLPRLSDELADDARSWSRLITEGLLETTTPWCVANIDLLRAAAERAPSAVAGDRLLHADLRADNILIDSSGRARLLDWPWAARGAGWEDALLYLLDLRVEDSTADVAPLLDHPAFGRSRTDDHVALLAAVAGSWFEKCRLPAPPGMTTLRDFQRREAIAAVEWIAQLSASHSAR
jgi:aminoglycoside phosphotransferase (APT) family kinase protein